MSKGNQPIPATSTNDQQQRPPEGYTSWRGYWKSEGMPWRIEPEIDGERQRYLIERRAIAPHMDRGIFPFRDENGSIKLGRADVEWLLAAHESEGIYGPVDWSDEKQRQRQGLDLRGADLRGTNLAHLPLSRVRCGISDSDVEEFEGILTEVLKFTSEETLMDFVDAVVDKFPSPHLDESIKIWGVNIGTAWKVHLEGAILDGAHLENAFLVGAHLERASLVEARMERAQLEGACLEEASLSHAHMEYACLANADCAGADLSEAHLDGANLSGAQLAGKRTPRGKIRAANLQGVFFDRSTRLDGLELAKRRHGTALLANVHWETVNITVIDWRSVRRVGEEQGRVSVVQTLRDEWKTYSGVLRATLTATLTVGMAQAAIEEGRSSEEPALAPFHFIARLLVALAMTVLLPEILLHDVRHLMTKKAEFHSLAERANLQLAMLLRSQGLVEDANRLAYRAQVCARRNRFWRLQIHRYVGSLLLSALSGYGYRLWRIFASYVFVLLTFATLFYLLGIPNSDATTQQQAILDSLLVSLTAIHGRVFFEQLSFTPQAWIAAVESVIGIVIEGVFIAMLIQRWFQR